jgi:hypothetical protein
MTETKGSVVVKQSDLIEAVSLLKLLVEAIDRLKEQVKDVERPEQRYYIAGAVESLTDLHNLILEQVSDARKNELFNGAKKGEGFDA